MDRQERRQHRLHHGGEHPGHLDDTDIPVVATICGSGYGSSVASSLLAAHDHDVMKVLVVCMTAWNNAHYPTDY